MKFSTLLMGVVLIGAGIAGGILRRAVGSSSQTPARSNTTLSAVWASRGSEEVTSERLDAIQQGLKLELATVEAQDPALLAEVRRSRGVSEDIIAHDFAAQSFAAMLVGAKSRCLDTGTFKIVPSDRVPINLASIERDAPFFLLSGIYDARLGCLFKIERESSPEAYDILLDLERIRASEPYRAAIRKKGQHGKSQR